MHILLSVYSFVFGLVIGSFANVCIYRIPRGESIVYGRSYCTGCGKPILNRDLVPVFSYLFLRGRCRYCKEKISVRYPAVELATAFLYLFLFLKFGTGADFFICAAFFPALIILSFIDFSYRIIPDRIILSILIIGIFSVIFSRQVPLYERIIGFFSASVPMLLIYIVSRGGMGEGDIKLMAVCGLVLGYKLTVLSLLLACIAGSVYGLAGKKNKKEAMKSAIPFGPFLSAAMGFCVFFGDGLIALYVQTFFRH